MRSRVSRRWMMSAALLAAVASTGCAEERDPINRVQPDALAKSFFLGEKLNDYSDDPTFYWRNFVVDGSEAQSMVGVGSWGAVERIRWDVQEDMLYARRAYQNSPGADDKGAPNGPANGTVVAAYRIVNHFDIRRDYNPQTGEEMNVVTENSSDRPWYERSHFRVDWSMNLVDTPMWMDMFMGKLFGNIKLTPFAYYVNNRKDPDAVHFEASKGYFDVTSKFQVEPEAMESPFYDLKGTIPACILNGIYAGSAVDTCDIQEAVIRSSYWRVDQSDPDDDFEPFENTRASLNVIGNPGGLGNSFQVGIVTPPRVAWDPQYGYNDANMVKYFHHHNIWQQSHQPLVRRADGNQFDTTCDYSARADEDNNGTDDQCESGKTGYAGSLGSQCSLRNRCTIPYRDRKIKTVGYWINAETPPELTDPVDAQGNPTGLGHTEQLTATWNQAMSFSVAKAREMECRATGGARAECNAQYFVPGETEMIIFGGWGIPKIQPLEDKVLVTCHNPVRSYDHAICGERGSSARVGDVRKNFMFFWPYESRAPWGGIANWNADPVTGQILGASATTMGRSAYRAAAQVRDIIMVANGELTIEDITGGVSAELYQKKLREGDKPYAMTPQELQQRVASVDARAATATLGAQGLLETGAGLSPLERGIARVERINRTVAGPAAVAQSDGTLRYEAVADKVRGSIFEAEMMSPGWLVDTLRVNPASFSGRMSDAVMEAASPLRGMDPGNVNVAMLRQTIDLGMQARGVCFLEQAAGDVGNLDVQGVARWFKQKFNDNDLSNQYPGESAEQISKRRADAIYTYLWHETYKGIALHEVGHSLGMLHQFTSSYDATNFNPQYWQIRSQNGKASAMRSCNGNPRTGDTYAAAQDSCMGPRYLDPETDEELGRGAESRPGINYYANTSTMEYQNERFFETVGLGSYDLMTMGVLYGRIVQTFDKDVTPQGLLASNDGQDNFAVKNYTQLTEQNLNIAGNAIFTPHYTEEARRMRLFDDARDCRPATQEEQALGAWRVVYGKVCQHAPRDYARWDDMLNGSVLSQQANVLNSFKIRVRPGQDNSGNVRWPYRWGSSNNSYVHTNPGDAGADIYEAVVETIRKHKYNYPFQYFRRGNRDWVYRNIPARVSGALFERFRAFHWQVAAQNARNLADGSYDTAILDDNGWRPYILAETLMFDAVTDAFLSPQPGNYRLMPGTGGSTGVPALYDVPAQESTGTSPPFRLDASNSRYVDPDFNSEPEGGGSWEYQSWVNHTGFTAEKVDAIRMLADGRPVFFTISRENYLDGRNVFINFRSDMPKAMDRLIGGVLAQDWNTVAPYVDPAETAATRVTTVRSLNLWADTPARPAGAYAVFPNVGYKQQLGTLVFAHIFARLNTDLSLANKLRIHLQGYGGSIDLPLAEQVRFTNPETGFTYYAKRYGADTVAGQTVDQGIGSRMLARANALLAEVYVVDRDGTGQPILDANGMVSFVLDGDGHPQLVAEPADPTSTAHGVWLANIDAFRKYVGLIDAAVQLQQMVGYGPLNGLPGDFE